jgi:cobalt-zinc-cadmium efflux system membrane fusion protein
MKKIHIIPIMVLFLAFMQGCGPQEEPQEQEVIKESGIPSQVRFGPLEPQMFGVRIEASGRVEVPPSDLVSVHSRVEAFIDRIYVLPGEQVKRGSHLFTISHPIIIQKQRELLEARAELDRARSAYDRITRLDSVGATYSAEQEQVMSERDFWKARTEGLMAECRSIGLNVDHIIETRSYQEQLTIKALSEGTIQEVMVNRGMVVAPEQVLLQLTDGRHVHLELSVAAKDASRIELGQQVDFGMPGSQERFSAQVVKIDPMLDESTGVLRVHCHMDTAAIRQVRPGHRVLAVIEVGAQERFALERSAVIKRGQGYFGFLREGDAVKEIRLEQAEEMEGSILFEDPGTASTQQWVLDGAYYLE